MNHSGPAVVLDALDHVFALQPFAGDFAGLHEKQMAFHAVDDVFHVRDDLFDVLFRLIFDLALNLQDAMTRHASHLVASRQRRTHAGRDGTGGAR
jgi:hypothetical protein